ncbi:MAG: hypothetical protein ACK47M_04525 [Caldilinea sp.]
MQNRVWRVFVIGLLVATFMAPMGASAFVVSVEVGRTSALPTLLIGSASNVTR